jgi:hypothetical protein
MQVSVARHLATHNVLGATDSTTSSIRIRDLILYESSKTGFQNSIFLRVESNGHS